MNAARGQSKFILLFLSCGISVFPVLALYTLFFRPFIRLLETHVWLGTFVLVSSAVIEAIGMDLLDKLPNKRLLATLGTIGWMASYVLAWEFSAHLFKW